MCAAIDDSVQFVVSVPAMYVYMAVPNPGKQKTSPSVAPTGKDSKNERISIASRPFIFWPIGNIRLRKKVVSKFSHFRFQNFQISDFKFFRFQISKFSDSRFQNFQISKFSDFRFQNFQISDFKIFKSEIWKIRRKFRNFSNQLFFEDEFFQSVKK